MTNVIFSFPFDEAGGAASPQLPVASFAPTLDVRSSTSSLIPGRSETAGAADRPSAEPSQLALIVALAAELEASEARARCAEYALAAHGRHCICRATEIAGEEITSGEAVGSLGGMAGRPAMAGADGAGCQASAVASDRDILSLAA